MRTGTILLTLACAVTAVGGGLLLFRIAARQPQARLANFLAWSATILGYAWVAMVAFAFFAGRFGPQQLWFRAPIFYVCVAILLAGVLWWFTRPAPPRVRFGVPAAGLGLLVLLAILLRVDGHSAPLAMLMPTMNARAPDLTYFDTAGNRRSLSELQGNVVLLNFWATWCSPCRREMPLLSKMQREHSNDGFVVLYVSLEEPAVLEEFLATNHFNGIQGRLERAPAFYDAGKFYPLSYLIGRDGSVAERWSGRPDEEWLAGTIREELELKVARR